MVRTWGPLSFEWIRLSSYGVHGNDYLTRDRFVTLATATGLNANNMSKWVNYDIDEIRNVVYFYPITQNSHKWIYICVCGIYFTEYISKERLFVIYFCSNGFSSFLVACFISPDVLCSVVLLSLFFLCIQIYVIWDWN